MSSITPHIEIARELVGKKHQRFSSIVHPDKSKATWDGPFCIPETRATVTSLLQDCNHSTSELDRLHEKLS